jgi:copper homeostasis protein
MIRPRGGDFIYSDAEFKIMKEDIAVCKSLGCYGVVFGMLTKDSKVDVEKTIELRKLAFPMQVTFHKAFDLVSNPSEELEKLVMCGVDRILTSGTKETAEEGIEVLKKLNSIAGDRIKIIAAGKVTKENVDSLKAQINCQEFHGRKIV